MGDVLLVNPDCGGNRDIPSLPLGYLAAGLHTVKKVVDLNTIPENWERVRYEATLTHSVLMSVQTRSLPAAKRLANELRNCTSVGAVRAAMTPIDVQCCYKYVPVPGLDTVTFNADNFASVPSYEKFDSFPTFLRAWRSGCWPYALMTSFGCPYKCTYCAARERGWKARSMEDTWAEVRHALHLSVKCFTLLDDCFNLREDHALAICDLMADANTEWMCTNGLRLDRLTEKSAKAMADSGCHTVGVGIESADDGVLERIRKGETRADLERGLKIAKRFFDSVAGYFIIGMPGSSYETDKYTLDWATRQGIYIHVSYWVPENPDGQLMEGLSFYGAESGPWQAGPANYPAEQQRELFEKAQGLAWGSKRDWRSNLRGRFRLGCRALPYLRMDAAKLRRRWARS